MNRIKCLRQRVASLCPIITWRETARFFIFIYRHKYVETLDNLMNFQSLNNDSSSSLTNTKNSPQKRSELQPDTDNLDRNNHLDTKDRTKLLKSIKKKVKSGYYNSNEVIDEISDVFAKVFDKTL